MILYLSSLKLLSFIQQQEPWRPPFCQADFTAIDRLRLDANSNYQAVTGNQGYLKIESYNLTE